MRKKLLVTHTFRFEEETGGIASIMKNMHPYLSEAFEVDYMTLPKSWQHGSTRAAYFIYMWLHRKKLKKYDFILSQVPEASYWVVKSKVPCAHIYHGDGHPMKGGHWIKIPFIPFYDYLFKVINKKCPLIYCVGKKRHPTNKKLYNPLIQDVAPLPIEQRKGFIFTGRLVNLKRVDRIIDIYAKLPKEIQDENPLYIIGDGYCRESLEQQVKDLGLSERVFFLGKIPNEEIMKILASKRILLMASTTEGFPTSIAEAFSLGIPAVTTNVGSVSSVVENNVNGFLLFKDFDDTEYVKYIKIILNEYSRFSENAINCAKLFNAEKVTKGVIEDINEILKKQNHN